MAHGRQPYVSPARSPLAQVPYRDSKLTHMLSDALGGNCRTSLVVCVSPATADASESSGTLEFGTRAMKVRRWSRIYLCRE